MDRNALIAAAPNRDFLVTVEYFDEPVYRPPAKPTRPPIDKRPADPRQALAGAARDAGLSLAELSFMLRRFDGYLARFVREGCPRCLTEREHRLLADVMGLDERALGVRTLWAQDRG
jgi:hypothetical protein